MRNYIFGPIQSTKSHWALRAVALLVLFISAATWGKDGGDLAPPLPGCETGLLKTDWKPSRALIGAAVDGLKHEDLAGLNASAVTHLLASRYRGIVFSPHLETSHPEGRSLPEFLRENESLKSSPVRLATEADIPQIEAIADGLQMGDQDRDKGFLSSRITASELSEIIKDGLSFVYDDGSGVMGFALMFNCKSAYGSKKSQWTQKAVFAPGVDVVNLTNHAVIARAIAVKVGAPNGVGAKIRMRVAQLFGDFGSTAILGKISLLPLNEASMRVHLRDGFSIVGSYVDENFQTWAVVVKPN